MGTIRITRFSSGFPVTLVNFGDNSLLGSEPNGINNFGVDEPDNFDIALLKSVRLAEAKSLRFRIEAFNAFNHSQFFGPQSVDGNIDSPLSGTWLARLRHASFKWAPSSSSKRREGQKRQIPWSGSPTTLPCLRYHYSRPFPTLPQTLNPSAPCISMVTAVAAAVHKVDLNGANLDFEHDSTYYVWHLRIV